MYKLQFFYIYNQIVIIQQPLRQSRAKVKIQYENIRSFAAIIPRSRDYETVWDSGPRESGTDRLSPETPAVGTRRGVWVVTVRRARRPRLI